jgi:hypothetical protein
VSDENAGSVNHPIDENPIDLAPGLSALPDGFVPIYDSPDFETAEIVCATLAAQGIHAVMQNPTPGPASNALPFLGNTWSHGVYVAPEDAEVARALLLEPAPSEDELAAEQAADPTTLEEAEKNVRNA